MGLSTSAKYHVEFLTAMVKSSGLKNKLTPTMKRHPFKRLTLEAGTTASWKDSVNLPLLKVKFTLEILRKWSQTVLAYVNGKTAIFMKAVISRGSSTDMVSY